MRGRGRAVNDDGHCDPLLLAVVWYFALPAAAVAELDRVGLHRRLTM